MVVWGALSAKKFDKSTYTLTDGVSAKTSASVEARMEIT